MRKMLQILALALILAPTTSCQNADPQPPALALAAGRPAEAGITRTTLRDDAKSTVTRVLFAPGAGESLHTHPFDLLVVPVKGGSVDWVYGDSRASSLAAGEVQFVPRDQPHRLTNTGNEPFELIAVAVKLR